MTTIFSWSQCINILFAWLFAHSFPPVTIPISDSNMIRDVKIATTSEFILIYYLNADR